MQNLTAFFALSDLVQPMSHKMDARLYGLKLRDYSGKILRDLLIFLPKTSL